MHIKFWWRDLFEDRKGGYIETNSKKQSVRMRCTWYLWCWTFRFCCHSILFS